MKLNKSRQRGQAVLEVILSIIMFVILFLGISAVSLYLFVQCSLVSAARDGARTAALNLQLGDPATQSTGVKAVQDSVIAFAKNTAGVSLSYPNITVAGPTGAIGNRQVTVTINYQFNNPVPLQSFLTSLNATYAGLDKIQLSSSASMRYED